MEKDVEKDYFATGASRSSEIFLLERECVRLNGPFFMFYHLTYQRDIGSNLTLES